MKIKITSIVFVLTFILVFVGCNDVKTNINDNNTNQNNNSIYGENKNTKESVVDEVEISETEHKPEDLTEIDIVEGETAVRNIVATYEVGDVFCIPSTGFVNYEVAMKSPIVGKIIEFDGENNIFIDNEKFFLDEQSTLSMKDLIDIYKLYYDDADKFKGSVERLRYEGENISFSIMISNDEKYFIQLREVFETDAFYELKEIK